MTNVKKIGPYQIIEKIGSGGFAEVFKVKRQGKFFALKKLLPYMKYDPEYQQQLLNEAKVLSQISDQHFPKLYEKGVDDEENYLVLEWIEGLTLESLIQKSFHYQKPLEIPLACYLAKELTLGLQKLHQLESKTDREKIHGDIRPSNVMLSIQGQVKLIDLGLKGGTFAYMPLERIHGKKMGAYSDIYAIGHLLYEMLHGKLFFKGETKLEAYFQMRELEIKEEMFDTKLPKEVRNILMKSLNQDPKIRYPSFEELQKDLEKFLQQKNYPMDSKTLGKLAQDFLIMAPLPKPTPSPK